MIRALLAALLDVLGIILIAFALWVWIPAVAIGFAGLGALYLAWTVEERTR